VKHIKHIKHIKGRAQKSSFLAAGAGMTAATAGSLLLFAAAVLFIGTASGRAEAACTLTIEGAEAEQVHATRGVLAVHGKSASETVHYTFEYSRDGSSWQVAGSGTAAVVDFQGTVGSYGATTPVHRLSPESTYFGRVIVENGCTAALKRFEFKTTAVSAPEVIGLKINQQEAGVLLAIGREYADYEAEIEGNGAETKYRFEINTTGLKGPWPEKPAAGTGTSGAVTVLEDFTEAKAHITGLSPKTTYYLRVVAENGPKSGEKRESEESESFQTSPLSPEAFISSVSGVGASSAHVHGAIDPRSSATTWRFEYATSEGGHWEPGPEGTIAAVDARENPSPVEAELTGLHRETRYYVRLHADNGFPPPATSRMISFDTAGSPVALTFAAHTYVPGGETIRALGSVEPHGYDTHYHFEYVTQEGFAANEWASAASTPDRDAGSGAFENGWPAIIIGEDLPGLQPGRTYHYRLVASSAQGTVGGDRTMTAPVPAPAEEPACSNKSLRSGASGHLPDCRAYEQVTPAEKKGSMDNWAYSGNVSTPVLVGEDGEHAMVRAQFSRWGTNVDASVNSYFLSRKEDGWQMTSATPQPQAAQNSYRPSLFSADLTRIGLDIGSSSTLEKFSPNLELVEGAPGGPYTPVTSAPRSSEPKWVAASRDFGTLVLSKGGKLYEWWNGELRQVDSCAATMAQATDGGAPGGAVSEDGSRVFFDSASGSGCSGASHLYMRVDHGGETIDLGAYSFLAANAQGSSVLVERQGGGTYEYLLYDTESKAAKPLFSAHEQLHVSASTDLLVIYVSSKEQLVPEAPPLSAESEYSGHAPEELYRYDVSGARLRFIVQTSGSTGYVTADGRYYYWESNGVAAVFSEVNKQFKLKLNGGEEGFATESQVYRYDSVENVVQCMSCASSFDPRPQLTAEFLGSAVEGTINGVPSARVASDNGDYVFFDTPSALVPQDTDGELYAGTHNYFIEEHDFNYSPSSDVYEWRKNGVDGCSHVQGCLALISSGTGGLKNVLLGTTPSGHDVFFATHSQLVGQDTDGQGDVYDARTGGGFPPPAPPPTECEGDACLSPLAAPIDTTPASLSFSGSGNLTPLLAASKPTAKPKAKPCKKGTVRKKGRCVKKRQPRKAARRAVRRNRGGGR
jgi:hypothetical protein